MSVEGHHRNGIRSTSSKRLLANISKLSLTNGPNVRLKSNNKPRKSVARLEPWLRFANQGIEDGQPFEYVTAAGKGKKQSATDPEFRMVLRAWLRSWFKSLVEAGERFRKGVAGPRLTLQPPRMERPTRGWLFTPFEIDRDGILQTNSESLYEDFCAVLAGTEVWRFRKCEICPAIFFAVRSDQETCSRRCNAVRGMRKWRAKQGEYEYNRKLKLAGVKDESKTRQGNPRREVKR
jgi:hypothetical protein